MSVDTTKTFVLRHDALFYGTDAEFLAGVVPFVQHGLADGEAVVAAVTRANIELLRDTLGPDAAQVHFIDRDEWYRRPATTVAGWQQLLDQALDRGHPSVRIIGEVAFGAQQRHPTWTRYEAALNRLFAAVPAWIVCPYDSRTLTEDVLADARRTHPAVQDPHRRDSNHYQAPELLLRGMPEPLPVVDGPPQLLLPLRDTGDLAAIRAALRNLVAGWPADRLDELLLVVTEVAANGLEHGRGERQVTLWFDGQRLVCEISDEGPGPTDPLAGYAPLAGRMPNGGWGLWIAHQLCDEIAIDTRDGRTRVRLSLSTDAAEPHPR